MSATISSDVTLLTEHLTYRPAALIDDIVNSINILAFRATEAVEKGLLSANPSDLGFKLPKDSTTRSDQAAAQELSERAKAEIENGVHQLETLLETKIDKNFDRLEIFALRNMLSVPPEVRDWVRLSHYEGVSVSGHGAGSGDAPSSEDIALQRRKLRETQKLHSLLLTERAKNEATIASLKELLNLDQGSKKESGTKQEDLDLGLHQHQDQQQPQTQHGAFAFLQNKGDLTGDVAHPVTTSTSFALSQLPALKGLLDNLQPRLDNLATGSEKDGMLGEEEKSWRRQRLEFIETQTRRHLENVRGLELGEMGEVRDGEWQGEGRRFARGEVDDLERVVGMVVDSRGGAQDAEVKQ